MTAPVLTLGGFRPGSAYWGIPGKKQTWWKPCIVRGENGDTHCWYLSPTSDGSLRCWSCRVGAPRVVVGPREWIAEIREAQDAGDTQLVRRLLANRPDPTTAPAPAFIPRDWNDWDEFWRERTAIFEFLGGMGRDAADAAALNLAGPEPVR